MMKVKFTDFNDNNIIKTLIDYPKKKKAEWIAENHELRLIINRLLLDQKNMIEELNLIRTRLELNNEVTDES